MSKHHRSMVLIYIFVGIAITLTPILIAKLMDISLFSWMTKNNDWIGFWGGYLGGLLTLLGVFATILFTKKTENNKQKLLLRPYLIYDNINYENNSGYICLRATLDYTDNNTSDYKIHFRRVIIIGNIRNVGLGTAIQCKVAKAALENKAIDLVSDSVGAITENGYCRIFIQINNVDVIEDELSRSLVDENRRLASPDFDDDYFLIHFSFVLSYEDLIGTFLSQEFVFITRVFTNLPINKDKPEWELEKLSKPFIN